MKRLLAEREEDSPVCDECGYPVPEKFLNDANTPYGNPIQVCTLCYHSRDGQKAFNFAANAILDQLGAFEIKDLLHKQDV